MYSTLSKVLTYDGKNGNFYWRENVGGKSKKNKIAGYKENDGYIRIKYSGRVYLAHKVAWFFKTNKVALFGLDHINGNRSDNRLENLRLADTRQNAQNRKRHRNGSLQGTSRHTTKKGTKAGWYSYITVNKNSIYLGYYQTEEEAHLAYLFAINFYEVTYVSSIL